MYLDLDVILAELKEDEWLASEVEIEAMEAPKISVATGIELQYVMKSEWPRDRWYVLTAKMSTWALK